MTESKKEPSLLKATALAETNTGDFKWHPSCNKDLLVITNEGITIEWELNSPRYDGKYLPLWVSAPTCLQLHSGKYRWDFVVDEMACAQIGLGFMLQWDIGPDWGFFGYLGASNSAWSYDPSTGDIVRSTKSIIGGLPKFSDGHKGVVSVELNLPRYDRGVARFIVDGIDTPSIDLPESSVVLPAACLLKETQKVTLANFQPI